MRRYASLPPPPERIARLEELATDLWWSWHRDARMAFRQLDYELWRVTDHNPVRMLWTLPRETLAAAAADPEFLAYYDRAVAALDAERRPGATWWEQRFPQLSGQAIAYFSAEFALHQSLPIYAGGLGVLAGDHCKEACDLGVPLVGVGFMYPQGYFHQHVSAEGWQEESYERLNWADAPIEAALTSDGRPLLTAVPLGDRSVLVAVWRVRVGRVTLYLLDTDLEENAPWDRELSARSESRRACSISTKATPASSFCSASAIFSSAGPRSTPRSPRSAAPPCSRRTPRCRPDTTRFRSTSWRNISRGRGARSARTARRFSRSARTTTAAASCST
jgi:starch phosphorylase